MDHFECDGLHDETFLRSCEEFDSSSENRLISFDQQAICKFILVVVHTADNCTYCLHTCAKALIICLNQ